MLGVLGLVLVSGMLFVVPGWMVVDGVEGVAVATLAQQTQGVREAVDANQASEAALQKVPGIGPTMARRIVEWREKNGRFERLDDLLNVRGIGVKSLATLPRGRIHQLRLVEMMTIDPKHEALAELCSQYHVGSLEVFGSAAIGQLRDDSDLDFLVEFQAVDSMTIADQYFGLLEALERLFGRKIDLLTRRCLRNPYFVDSVEKTRQVLYAA